MKYCTKCGTQYPDEMNVCPHCQTVSAPVPAQEPTQGGYAAPQAPVYAAPQAPVYEAPQAPVYEAPQAPVYEAPQAPVYEAPQAPVYAAPQAPVYAAPAPSADPLPPMETKKKKSKAPLIIALSAVAVVAALAVLVLTHVICIFHDYAPATCLAPETCTYCGATQGIALGHTNGDWKVKEAATLMEEGEEALHCSMCSAVLETRTTEVKTPMVMGEAFNFQDVELIEWINDRSTLEIDTTASDTDEDEGYTAYNFTGAGGSGFMIFDHDEAGNVTAIFIYSGDDSSLALAMAAWIAYQIDPQFNNDSAISALARGKSYRDEGMVVGPLDLDDYDQCAFLSTETYYDNN